MAFRLGANLRSAPSLFFSDPLRHQYVTIFAHKTCMKFWQLMMQILVSPRETSACLQWPYFCSVGSGKGVTCSTRILRRCLAEES